MKKSLSILAVVLLLCFAVMAMSACKDASVQTDALVVYNWADYIYDVDLEDFKAYYKQITGNNIDITYVTFDTNETMLTRLMQGDSRVDLVCPSEYAIQKLLESGRLLPMHYFDEQAYAADFSDKIKSGYVHYSDNIEQGIVDKVSDAFGSVTVQSTGETVSMIDYFVPYMYGTLGILYNKTEFENLGIYDKQIMNKANWGILFNDDGDGNILSERLTGNILMKDSIRDSYAATVFYLLESGRLDGKTNSDGVYYTDLSAGELINAVDDTLISLCEEVLTEQKSQLFGYEVDFGKDDLLQGNAIVDLAWSGDALYAVEESDGELAYYVPNTAGNIWFDGWVVPDTCNPEHMDAIKLFINFLNSPAVAAANMLEIGYTSAVDPEAVRGDDEARAVLAEGYCVYAPEYWDVVDEDGTPLQAEDCDFADWAEFEEYFFDSVDEIDGSNWRYPFMVPEDDPARSLDTLGVMRDFGANNKAVVTMWNYARSAGINALPLLLWTLLAIAVVIGLMYLAIALKRLHRQKLHIKRSQIDTE